MDTDSDSDNDNIFVRLKYKSTPMLKMLLSHPLARRKCKFYFKLLQSPNLVNSGITACSSGKHSLDDKDSVPTVLPKSPIPDTETGLGERLIRDLTISLIGKYHRAFFDNYFSLVCLVAYLQENKIYGTVRANRKFLPSDISEDKILRRGETDWRQATNELTNVNRRQKDGFLQVVPCLSIGKDYNKFMGGVDKADMLQKRV
ncbi:hypothetical protein ILUMI_23694 [Ignelater luminosus]|uniref:PiggyBac transposable element-derived protein domain-containing protein n=1 Tax=Ignelater luminosus TaxID=2038154 RepID=A0A8K0CAG1_IGNLU|nr:hypothetical protein ILUMI_23694 [Ignelater luminosus]